MKRLAFMCSLLFSVAFAQSYEYIHVFETSNPLNPAKSIITYKLADSDKYVKKDSLGNKLPGLLKTLNRFGAEGWRVVHAQTETIQRIRQSAYLLERKTPTP